MSVGPHRVGVVVGVQLCRRRSGAGTAGPSASDIPGRSGSSTGVTAGRTHRIVTVLRLRSGMCDHSHLFLADRHAERHSDVGDQLMTNATTVVRTMVGSRVISCRTSNDHPSSRLQCRTLSMSVCPCAGHVHLDDTRGSGSLRWEPVTAAREVVGDHTADSHGDRTGQQEMIAWATAGSITSYSRVVALTRTTQRASWHTPKGGWSGNMVFDSDPPRLCRPMRPPR